MFHLKINKSINLLKHGVRIYKFLFCLVIKYLDLITIVIFTLNPINKDLGIVDKHVNEHNVALS